MRSPARCGLVLSCMLTVWALAGCPQNGTVPEPGPGADGATSADAGPSDLPDAQDGPEADPGTPELVPDFPPEDPETFDAHPALGIITSRTRALALRAEGASADDALAAIEASGATVIGELEAVGTYLVEVPDPGDHEAIDAVVAALRGEAALEAVTRVPLLLPQRSPGSSTPREKRTWDYQGLVEGPAAGPLTERFVNDASWGVEAIRAPAVWNLRDFLLRREAAGKRSLDATVVVCDGDFVAEDDLELTVWGPKAAVGKVSHGSDVASVIAATWGNGEGVDGLAPVPVKMLGIASAHEFKSKWNLVKDVPIAFSALFEALQKLLDEPSFAPVAAINLSLGYVWDGWPSDAAFSPAVGDDLHSTEEIEEELVEEAKLFAKLAAHARDVAPGLVFTTSAGNDSATPPVIHPKYNSPMNWAFMVDGLATNGLVVGETAPDNLPPPSNLPTTSSSTSQVLSTQSDRPALIYAPGHGVGVATGLDHTGDVCGVDVACGVAYGTSFAAPMVAGVATLLHLLRPEEEDAVPADGLLQAILAGARVVSGWTDPDASFTPGGAVLVLDALGAAMELDDLYGEPVLHRALADLDDGSPDGCLRVRRGDDGAEVAEPEAALGPGETGDDVVDMRDLRCIRDAMHLIYDGGGGLDGMTGQPPFHPRMDLNGDDPEAPTAEPPGALNTPGAGDYRWENIWPRADLNGDSVLHPSAAPLLFEGAAASDLDVLAEVWGDAQPWAERAPDVEGWDAADRVAMFGTLMESADVTVRVGFMFDDPEHQDVDAVEVHVWRSDDAGTGEPPHGGTPPDPDAPWVLSTQSRRATRDGGGHELVFTVPLPATADGQQVFAKAYYVTTEQDPSGTDWPAAEVTIEPEGGSLVGPSVVAFDGLGVAEDRAVSFGPKVLLPTTRYVYLAYDPDTALFDLLVVDPQNIPADDLLAAYAGEAPDELDLTGGLQCSATGEHVVFQIGDEVHVYHREGATWTYEINALMQVGSAFVSDARDRMVWAGALGVSVTDLTGGSDATVDAPGLLLPMVTGVSPDGGRALLTDLIGTSKVTSLGTDDGGWSLLNTEHLHVLDLDTGALSLVYDVVVEAVDADGDTHYGRVQPFDASFAPDGVDAVFVSPEHALQAEKRSLEDDVDEPDDALFEIYRVTPGDPEAERLTYGAAAPVKHLPVVSPDGGQVLYWSHVDGVSDQSALWLASVGGSEAAVLRTVDIDDAAVILTPAVAAGPRLGACWLRD